MLDLAYISFVQSFHNMNLKKLTIQKKGYSTFFYSKFKYRLEILKTVDLNFLSKSVKRPIYNMLNTTIPVTTNYETRHAINIFFLDIITVYKGWRHSNGLPARGQRTWTNAWTAYKNNLVLRKFKANLARKLYGNQPSEFINMAQLAEDVNAYWKLQWVNEWREAKKKRLWGPKNDYDNTYKIDLRSMAKKNVWGFTKKERRQKKKVESKKNVFALGFDPGFVKVIMKMNSNYKNIFMTTSEEKKKKPQKKKPQKKKILKKKKKSVWD